MTLVAPPPDDLFLAETGEWLVTQRRALDSAEGEWLGKLGEFNAAGGYELDGHYSPASWLVLKCGMARSTAHEKVQVAAELRRRPWLAKALSDGTISYSAARVICRIDKVDTVIDTALIDLAVAATIDDVERAVRHFKLILDQDRPPRPERTGYRMTHGFSGLGKATIEAPNEWLDEIDAVINSFMERKRSDPEAPPDPDDKDGPDDQCDPPAPDDPAAPDEPGEPGEQADPADPALPGALATSPPERPTMAALRLDALMRAVRVALANPDAGYASGADLYMVHIVADLERLCGGKGRAALADGMPIDDATLAMIACDSSTVAHLTRDGVEPLILGRKSREWSIAQRRAIMVRDGGICRHPGCDSTHCDIHHLRPWEAGGHTDTSNGAPGCRTHHRLWHNGSVIIEGDAGGTLTFRRADGTLIGTTTPRVDAARLL